MSGVSKMRKQKQSGRKVRRRLTACGMAILLGMGAVGCGAESTAPAGGTEVTGDNQAEDNGEETDNTIMEGNTGSDGIVYRVQTNTTDLDETHVISDTLFGLFLEDINYAVDGGMYPEMIKNRSFEYGMEARDAQYHGWQVTDESVTLKVADGSWADTGESETVQADNLEKRPGTALHENNPHYAVVTNPGYSSEKPYAGICNSGYIEGMAIQEGMEYEVSFYAKSDVAFQGDSVYITLMDEAGTIYAEQSVGGMTDQWTSFETTLTANDTANKDVLLAIEIPAGEVCFDMISMMPKETYQNLPVRKDFGEYLEALEPAFLRFPGGCVVEGRDEESIYSWKDSIGNGEVFYCNGEAVTGDVVVRPQGKDIWKGTAANPYYMTYGIGFYEYFELCEALDCMPVPVLNAGMTCEIQSPFYKVYSIASEEFQQYIQDALDLVEFCRGDVSTTWGAVRIAMGHEEPFPLQYIAIGNEQWQSEYHQHYKQFVKAFEKAAGDNPDLYGDIKLIVANGTVSDSEDGWNYLILNPDSVTALVDEHYYQEPEWFLANTDRYDSYDRNSQAKVFLGEYAAKANTLDAALAEAAYMTGLEKNGDVVEMACYAPLFAHEKLNQWVPDMIFYSNDAIFGSINYYVQQMFSVNAGAISLPAEITGEGAEVLYESASVDEEGDLILKVVNVSGEALPVEVMLEGADLSAYAPQAQVTVLSGSEEKAVNSRKNMAVMPMESTMETGENFTRMVEPYSLTVIRYCHL